MRLTAIILTAASLQVAARTSGQTVTINVKDAPIQKVFKEVSRQTGVSIVYAESLFKNVKPVTIQVKDASLREVLDQCLKGQPFEYKLRGNSIVVSPKLAAGLPPTDKIDEKGNPLPFIDVQGKVVNDRDEPVVGASIMVKDDISKGVTTDGNGHFELKGISENSTIVITGVNIISLEIKVNGKAELGTIPVQTKVTSQEEIIINAGYYAVSDREKTGSISKISSREIGKQPVINPMAALQGRMTGVQIVQSSGVPGAAFDILVRGRNSIASSSAPFFIVDGVPFSSESLGYNQVSRTLPGVITPLNTLSPGDIESIEVLKDADATAIYGSRGSNGVILITTKKGKAGKTSYDFNMQTGFGRVTRFVDMMNTEEFMKMRKEAYLNDGLTSYPATSYDLNGTWNPDRYTDWQKVLFGGTSRNNSMEASVSGGNSQTKFLIRGSYMSEATVFPGDFAYKKGSVLINLNHHSENRKFSIAFSANYTADKNNLLGQDITNEAINLVPNAPALYDNTGKLNWENGTFQNPLRHLESTNDSRTYSLLANSTMTLQILPELDLKTSIGYNQYGLNEILRMPSSVYNPALGLGSQYSSVIANQGSRHSWIAEPQLNWKKKMQKIVLDVLAGLTFQQLKSDQYSQYATGFPSNSLINNFLAASNHQILNSGVVDYKYQAFYGRVNLNYDKKYIFNLTGRRDGSSRFGPERQFANFAAAGGAWIITEEPFFSKRPSFLSFAKLRASFGVTGSDQIGNYQFLDTYISTGLYYNGVGGLRPNRLFNPDFGWESNKKLEAAFEVGIFDDRIHFTVSWYRNRSSNQLVGIPLPGTTGFTTLNANLDATVQNTGWEFELQTLNFKNKRFKWNTSFNLSIPRNKLVSFPGLNSSSYANQYVVGQPLSIVKLYNFTGFDPQSGVYQFEDMNNDGLITSPADRQLIRDRSTNFYGGIGNDFSFGRLSLDLFFQFVSQLNWNNIFTRPMPGIFANQPREFLDRWSQDKGTSLIQPYSLGFNNTYSTAHSRIRSSNAAIGDASFVRLKNLALAYKLPENWLKGTKCRVYLQGQNLLIITKYKGSDPEFITSGYLPPLRMITAGFQLTL